MSHELQQLLSSVAAFSSLLALIITVAAAAIAAYFAPYLKKRAEARAKAEDFVHALELVSRELRETEGIKSKAAIETGSEIEKRKAGLALHVATKTEKLKADLADLLEHRRGGVQAEIAFSTQVFAPRLEAYRRLWHLTAPMRYGRTEPLLANEKKDLYVRLTEWYYENGAGLFLSQEAMNRWLAARDLLATTADEKALRESFSDLRAQLKDDLGVYGLVLKRQQPPAGAAPHNATDA